MAISAQKNHRNIKNNSRNVLRLSLDTFDFANAQSKKSSIGQVQAEITGKDTSFQEDFTKSQIKFKKDQSAAKQV